MTLGLHRASGEALKGLINTDQNEKSEEKGQPGLVITAVLTLLTVHSI